ncbi:hypothetical protein BS78_01G417500 [Paspalum vaginatum]|nr:hypothetical protein BS78_01G417500 [Paspalum vaginatum]
MSNTEFEAPLAYPCRRHSCLCFNICCPQILLSNIKSVGQLLVANHVDAMHNERRVMSMNLLLARLPNTAVLAITLAGPMETLWLNGRTLAASPSCQLHELFSFLSFVTKEDFDGVVTCIPLYEPVEAYSFLGFPLGWRSRRDGSADHICKTCYRCFEVPRNGPRKAFPCGHDKSKVLCQMCYLMSCVRHPHPGEFAYGHSKN